MNNRRTFLQSLALAAVAAQLPSSMVNAAESNAILKPRRLKAGSTVGLINPAGTTWSPDDVRQVQESMAALGLATKPGRHVLDRYGYLAGTDADRAADVNEMFADSSVDAILCVRGGWGCNRILPLLDYRLIRKNPKILMGYSDITSLLVAIYAATGLTTFHGPVGTSTWNAFSLDFVKKILFNAETPVMTNPVVIGDNLAQTKDRLQTITPGKATGRLVGGNLSVLTAMIGSDYLPDWKGHILFLEDDGENVYRIDRMLTQLKLAGVLAKVTGFVFGKCTNCGPGEGYGSLTLDEVLNDHVRPLGIPAWSGAMIGHIENKFTLPIGGRAEIDAAAGSITMLEPAVV
jgi:muramoyltetrapeptide carboxypeptidase